MDIDKDLCNNTGREIGGEISVQSTIYATLTHVIFLARHLKNCTPKGAMVAMLMELGVPTKSVGFELLRHAIMLQFNDPTRSLNNDIYLEVAANYRQNSEEQVEQAIRDAIRQAWSRGSRTAWLWYFSYDGCARSSRPTNGEFISRIAYILELWQECVKKGGTL